MLAHVVEARRRVKRSPFNEIARSAENGMDLLPVVVEVLDDERNDLAPHDPIDVSPGARLHQPGMADQVVAVDEPFQARIHGPEYLGQIDARRLLGLLQDFRVRSQLLEFEPAAQRRVENCDCFCYLIDGKTLSAFGTRVGGIRSVEPWRRLTPE